MIELKVTICLPDGTVLDSFLAVGEAIPHAVHPQNMMAQVIRECIEDHFETKD